MEATTRPLPSITCDGPVFDAVTTGVRFSTARSTDMRLCCLGAAVGPNQTSFVSCTRSWAPPLTESRARSENKFSQQIRTPTEIRGDSEKSWR